MSHSDNHDALLPTEAFVQLRALLLDEEHMALAHMRDDLRQLQDRYGDKERFQQAVAEVLAEALMEARNNDQARLARSVSPIVAASIKREIANSKDEMVEALYPITGRLVAASVRNSIAKLTADINERLERLFSFKGLFQRWKVSLFGGSGAAMVLAETQKAEIRRAMIIERASGVLIAQWRHADDNGPQKGDPDLVSGLLSAISNLADEAFGGEETELRTLDLNGRQVALRRSPKHILALEFDGELTPDDRLKVDQAFADCVERLNNGGTDEAFIPFVAIAQEHAAPSVPIPGAKAKDRNGLWTIAVLALLAMVVWLGVQWSAERAIQSDIAKVEAVIAAEPMLDGFPLNTKADNQGRLVVSGLYPMGMDAERLEERLGSAIGARELQMVVRPVAQAKDFMDLQNTLNWLRRNSTNQGQ